MEQKNHSSSGARDTFLYLLLFGTLYTSATSVGAILFQAINKLFPDPLAYNHYIPGYDTNAVRWGLASLIIAFPIYLFLMWLIKKEFAQNSKKADSRIRKWLTYITLLIAAGLIIGDLIFLLFSLLGGELTARVGLKVLAVLAIGGTVFGYYLYDVQKGSPKI